MVENYRYSRSFPSLLKAYILLMGDGTDKKWLLIFDNIKSQSLCDKYWPKSSHGSVLVTTRNSKPTFCPALHRIELSNYFSKEGANFLIHRLSCLSGQEASVINAEFDQATEISSMLMGKPLLISQIAAFIQTKKLSLKRFLKENKPTFKNSSDNRAIWNLCFASLDEDAREFLGSLSFLMPDSIPRELVLRHGESATNRALDALVQSDLIRINPKSKTISLPRIVQEEFIRYTPKETLQGYFDGVVVDLLRFFPLEVEGAKKQPETYLPHALKILQYFKESNEMDDPLRLFKLINSTFEYVYLKAVIIPLVKNGMPCSSVWVLFIDNLNKNFSQSYSYLHKSANSWHRYIAGDDIDGNLALVVSAGKQAFGTQNLGEPNLEYLYAYFKYLSGNRDLNKGDFDVSESSLFKATLRAESLVKEYKASRSNMMASFGCRLGVARGSAGYYEKGDKCFERAWEYYKTGGDQHIRIMILVAAAKSFYCRGDFTAARGRLDKAFKRIDDTIYLPSQARYVSLILIKENIEVMTDQF